jgi:O-antigen/teichoic acid export membrane protein
MTDLSIEDPRTALPEGSRHSEVETQRSPAAMPGVQGEIPVQGSPTVVPGFGASSEDGPGIEPSLEFHSSRAPKQSPAGAGLRTSRRIIGNTATLFSAQVVSKVLGAIVTIIAARRLGAEDYGLYIFATTFGYVFAVVVAFGLPRLITRDVARDLEKTPTVLGRVLALEVTFTTLAVLGMLGVVLALGYSPYRALVVTVAGTSMVLAAVLDVVVAFFRAHQRMQFEALLRVSLSILNLGLSLAVIFAGYGVLALAVVQLGAFVLVLIMGVILAAGKLGRPIFSADWPAYRRLLLSAVPFALSTFFIFIYDGTTAIFLSFMKGDLATGLYSGAANFIRIFGILPASLVAAFLPAMAQLGQTSALGWRTLFQRLLRYLLIMALPIAVGLTMLSNEIVLLVLGQGYAASAGILRMAAWVVVLVFLNHGLSNALISIDREKSFLSAVGAAVVVNLVANLTLIPRWGAYGAVGASLLTEGLMCAAQSYALRKAGAKFLGLVPTVKPLLSVGLMAAAVHLAQVELGPSRATGWAGLIGLVVLGGMVYLAALFALRSFDSDEIELLRSYWATATTRLPGRLKQGVG